jgi:sporulation protein YlmC with PRC-barrel domain
MILSDLLGGDAFDADGRRLGAVLDVRLEISGAPAQLLADTIVTGVLVSPRSRFSTWGYERRGEDGPFLVARMQRWLHRGSFLVAWDDVELVDRGRIVFRAGYEQLDAMLPRGPREG